MPSDDEYYDEEDYYDDDEEEMMDGTQDEDDVEDDFKIAPKAQRKAYEIDYESLSPSAVERRMKDEVEHIGGILGVDESTAGLLLRFMGWNKERLIEKYMDNASQVLVDAGVAVPAPVRCPPPRRPTRTATRLFGKAAPTPAAATGPFVCPICFDESASLAALSLSCSHAFCSGCWSAYLTAKITDEAEHCIRCMAESCRLVAPDSFVRPLTPAWPRFHDLLLRHFVASSPALKFCPYPSCTNTVSCPSAAGRSVLATLVPIVSCGARGIGSDSTGKEHMFCFGCPIESDHRPVICAVARMWLKKCRDDSETANWIKSNTKECPKCQSTIEKNGGCNHMTCKKCKHEFCWVCMGPWQEHGTAWYSCNRYDEKASTDARDAQSRSRASLERYLHYYNRWANHEQSAKLSLSLYSKTEKKMEDMQLTSTLTWIEVQFMKRALEVVEKCRMTLKWTYAMAYYLEKTNEKVLFEDNQRDLERAVEELSEMLEEQVEPESIRGLRQKVTDKTVYVQKRNEIVLDDTATGFLESRWTWNVPVDGFDAPENAELDG
ncbi:hypothetical protein H2248_005403 [Termitomyces sp. 'cryptogamus']|nr:hypothetical protein H2248_005403 [Termitomyces sp. 'cryptogamus']